jgi:thiamine pyrophosphate-dependent acetolactate synthase large subunit-like protein
MTQTTGDQATQQRMPVAETLQVLADLRRDSDVLVTNQASARLWPTLSDHPLDLNYNPSTMGGAIPLALGLALAKPQREIIVVSGEGSLLMSLGSLVTVVGSGATNITIVVLDNGMYEVTGGQATPATNNPIDFAGLARAAGFPTAVHYSNLNRWRDQAPAGFSSSGPRLMWLQVGPTDSRILKEPSGDIKPRIERLRDALTD